MIYTCIDIETTGLSIYKDDPIQFSYLRFNDAFVVQTAKCIYIKPTRGVWSAEAESVHHIDRFFLAANGAEPDVAAASIWAVCSRSNLVGYNSKGFDWNLLSNWMEVMNLPQCMLASHTDVMSEWQKQNQGKRKKLTELCASLGMNPGYLEHMTKRYYKTPEHLYHAHDACYDTVATFLCYKRLVEMRRSAARQALSEQGFSFGGGSLDV